MLVVVGLALLLGGAWQLVRAAVAVSLMLGVSRVVVGATVVAFGTSAPEFVVSLVAALRGAPDIAVGNVVGSNVANVALVLGVAAAIRPLAVSYRLLRWEIPVLAVATAALILFAENGHVGHAEGGVMFAGLIAFAVLSPRLFPELAAAAEEEAEATAEAERAGRLPAPTLRAVARELGWMGAGIAALAFGANAAVEGASSLASAAGMSELAIGVVIVAIGTSLPELATSVVAAVRNEDEIAVANVVGSNIFNLLGVAGLTAAVAGLPVRLDLYRFELPALAASTLVLVPLAWPRYEISRFTGVALVGAYVAFVAATLAWS